MVRYSVLVFFMVSLVSIAGLGYFLESQYTGGVITVNDCPRYANELDIVFSDTIWRAQGKEGYSSTQEIRVNPCTGLAEQGKLELFVQKPPLSTYGYFKWSSGDVYAFQGAPALGKGNIQYWMCPGTDRSRVILYDTEVCNTFDNTFVFEDPAMPRQKLLAV